MKKWVLQIGTNICLIFLRTWTTLLQCAKNKKLKTNRCANIFFSVSYWWYSVRKFDNWCKQSRKFYCILILWNWMIIFRQKLCVKLSGKVKIIFILKKLWLFVQNLVTIPPRFKIFRHVVVCGSIQFYIALLLGSL